MNYDNNVYFHGIDEEISNHITILNLNMKYYKVGSLYSKTSYNKL
jgi:hypothetical protein